MGRVGDHDLKGECQECSRTLRGLLIVLVLACGQPAIPLGPDPRHAGNTGPGIGWSNPKIGPDLNSARGHAQCEEAEAQNILDTC